MHRALSVINHVKLFIIFVILLMLLPVGLLAYHNKPDGYNGMKWGADISTLKNMKYVKAEPNKINVVLYTREGDVLRLGNAILKSIEHGFFDGKFFSVTIKVANLFNYIALKGAVFEKFGQGTEFDQLSERYYWDGSTTRITLVSAFDLS
ncbi:MAG: hypothetical protein NTX36_03380 [Proteobacteria bacterium]|nr:hypothetical protein [Pseudomonadota bacterium]